MIYNAIGALMLLLGVWFMMEGYKSKLEADNIMLRIQIYDTESDLAMCTNTVSFVMLGYKDGSK